jgi:hypothetical protein
MQNTNDVTEHANIDYLAKADDSDLTRLCVGAAIVLMGTILGFYLVPEALHVYHWPTLIIAMVCCDAYAYYLYMYEFARLRAYMQHYFCAFGALLALAFFQSSGAGELIAAQDFSIVSKLVVVAPFLAALYAIAATHLMGAVPSVVIARKGLPQ